MEILALLMLVGMYSLYYKKKNGKSLFPTVEDPDLYWRKIIGYLSGIIGFVFIYRAIKSGVICNKQSITISASPISFWVTAVVISIALCLLIARSWRLSENSLGPEPGEVSGVTVKKQIIIALAVSLLLFRIHDSLCVYSITDLTNMLREIIRDAK